MTHIRLGATALFAASLAMTPHPTLAQSTAMTGDTRLACEAILCLSVAAAPAECRPSLRRYFDIRPRKLSDLVRQRLQFLQLCPASAQNPAMRSLVAAMAQGAGRCDAASLNAVLISEGFDGCRTISDQLPDYCRAYLGNPLLNQAAPVYIGTPDQGGFWADAPDQPAAVERYRQQSVQRGARLIDPPVVPASPR